MSNVRAMNYVGSISILDRGDAPAQAVIDRNARSLAQRIADETKDELEKVMTRVETIYSSFEDAEQIYGTSNLEYLQDINELEELMKDQVKKKKYQQQVTIFIVGFSDVCGQKLRLMQQVNEFFTENSKNIDDEDWFPTTPDLDLDEVSDKIDDSLQVARDLSKRLGDLNKEMIDYMANYAEKKASNKGKKKMEKALGQAREEVQALAEKLLLAQTELEEKEERLQATFKQVEIKNLEVQKFRTAAELAKKAVQDTEALQEEIAARDAKLLEQRQKLTRMEIELAQSNHMTERNTSKLANMETEAQQKILMLQKELQEQKQSSEEVKRDLGKFHEGQLTALREVHQQEIDDMKKQHAEQIKSVTGVSDTQSDIGKQFDLESEDGTSRQSSKQESRPSTKDKTGKGAAGKKLGSKSPPRKDGKGKGREYAEVAIQDEGGDPGSAVIEENKLKTPGTRQSRRSRSTLAPVEEFDDYEDCYDLDDEQSWTAVPKDQLQGRFAQYRRVCRMKLQEVEEQRQLTVAKTQRKVQLLKSQFVEHKTKWETERKVLIAQVEQAHDLQTEAEKEADQAMTQLEDFITEQEKLEEEEEARRSAILRGRSGSSSLSAGLQTPGAKASLPGTPGAATGPASAQDTPPESRTTQHSEELQNLMQQTDDAKVEELRERLAGTKSAPPGVDTLTTTANKGQATSVDESQTPDKIFKIDGDTEEDLRNASARSRASLRSHYKNRLEESRQAAEDRRTNTPQISIPSKMSVDDELILDDDDEFDEMALPDDLKEELDEQKRRDVSMYEMGTSPPPGNGREPSSHSVRFAPKNVSALVEHPILKQYLKTYDGVATFKDTLSKLFLDKDMMSASQILADLETLAFDPEKKVMPQVELITANALFILEEIASVIESAVMIDREPPVSSLMPYSRDEMRGRLPPTREASEDIYPAYTHPKMVTPASASATDQIYINIQDSPVGVAVAGGDVAVVDGGGVGADGTEPAVAMETTAAEVTPRAGREDRLDAPPSEAGSRTGSLHGSNKSSMSGTTKQYLADLQTQCNSLQKQLADESVKHEEQLRHNTVVMMEMQDTINELQRELSAIGKSSKKPRSATTPRPDAAKTPTPDQSLMFTRLDLERNAKIMKKAVLDQRLDADKYKDVVNTMDDYVSLPAQRLAHLVKKYVHHSRMKEIEENVKNSQSLDEGVFDTLDKMEALQNQRARQWAEKMDTMGIERLRLAAMLMDSLDNIEQESGLFLIKPMYSFRGRELKAPPTQKLARPIRTQPVPRHTSATHSATSFVPAPTPASNARRMDRHTPTHQVPVDLTALPPPPPSRPEDGVIGAGAVRHIITPQVPQLSQSYQTWNMSASHARAPLDTVQTHSLNTPRMLELDINRMLIGQNNVSTKLPHPPTDDRLQNANNNSLRSYVTVQRPTATLTTERPPSTHGGRDTGAPPSSPSPRPTLPVSPADRGVPRSMTSPDPLPPIGDRPPSVAFSDEPPRSPPGSSMYQSTTHDADENLGLKAENTRASSQLTAGSLSDDEGQA